MSNFELIDDFLANRLSEQDRKSFEQQLDGDPALKDEVNFQQQVVAGVRQARALELKSMLNNVPVGSAGSWSTGKIAAAVVSAGIVATTLYLTLNENKPQVAPAEKQTQGVTAEPEKAPENTVVVPEEKKEAKPDATPTLEQPTKAKAKEEKTKVVTPVQKPDLKVVDPSDELKTTEVEKAVEGTPSRTEVSASKMEVIIDSSDKKHEFHYQFVQGKLMLFGPFDKSLYEILEIHGDSHAVFLFYKENYFMLDETQTKVTKLASIRDGELLKKLREYRGR